MKEVIAIMLLLGFSWGFLFFNLSPIYIFSLIALIYAVWILTPPYPDMELLVTPFIMVGVSILIYKTLGPKRISKKKITLASFVLGILLTYTSALFILYLAIAYGGVTSLFGFNIDFFGWAG